MAGSISIGDVYDKDLNFLIGSGASAGLFPTLELGLKNELGQPFSLEELATQFEVSNDPRKTPLFMHYYSQCIRPAQMFTLESVNGDPTRENVLRNYADFLSNLLTILGRRQPMARRCNVFTTNYDGCMPLVADRLLREGAVDFVINDGARGFRKRYLDARHFNSFLCHTGAFDRHQTSIPQINLIHLHGSVYWRKDGSSISVDYDTEGMQSLLSEDCVAKLIPFSTRLNATDSTLDQLIDPGYEPGVSDLFWEGYEQLPIVNPTKWKFHETVFEEHYYQMLRLLSYELEKPNAVLIAFGFSFADEHILNLLKRSLSNPHLQVFVCCYNQGAAQQLGKKFRGFNNVTFISLGDGLLDFSAFNSDVFTLEKTKKTAGSSSSAEPLSAQTTQHQPNALGSAQ